ncbi:MAG: hypothetical protein V3T17_19200 [Pseudomonadales bacterium]
MASSDSHTPAAADTSGGNNAEADSLSEEVRALTAQQAQFKSEMNERLNKKESDSTNQIAELQKEVARLREEAVMLYEQGAHNPLTDVLTKENAGDFIKKFIHANGIEKAYNDYVVNDGSTAPPPLRKNTHFNAEIQTIPQDKNGNPLIDADGFVVIEPLGGSVEFMAQLSNAVDFTGSVLYDTGGNISAKTNGFVDTAANTAGGEFVSENLSKTGRNIDKTGTPYMTLHVGMKGINSTAWTALVGKIAKGGQVSDPFRFTVISSDKMFGANHASVPQIDRAIWTGTAFGDASLNCVRGNITSVSFVFEDGMIFTQTSDSASPLATLVDPRGYPCIGGKRINNIDSALLSKLIADGLESLGQGYAEAQIERTQNAAGSNDFVSNQAAFAGGNFAAAVGQSASEYITYMTEGIFDLVFVRPGVPVTLDIQQQINIDYGGEGRRKVFAGPIREPRRSSLD